MWNSATSTAICGVTAPRFGLQEIKHTRLLWTTSRPERLTTTAAYHMQALFARHRHLAIFEDDPMEGAAILAGEGDLCPIRMIEDAALACW